MNDLPLILIVDDEPSARQTMEAILWREGYELAFASNGEEALKFLINNEPDTILLDVMMPNLNGFDFCQQIKNDRRWGHIPTILVTALDSREDLIRGLEVGADEFLSKPVNGSEVRARVRTMLRIKKQYDDLQDTLKLREDMVDMIVHDMRNPLSILLLQSEVMMRDKALSSETHEGLRMIYAQVHRLDSFVNSLLMTAKMEKDTLLLNKKPTDVNALVLSLREGYELMADAAEINFELDLPLEAPLVSLDKNLFHRVLDNLISNAIKFSPFHSAVILRIAYPHLQESLALVDSPSLRVQVIDEGQGVPDEQRELIFEKFITLKVGSEKVPQLGLGLAFCKMVVEQHNGRIYVENKQPRGSIFTVEI